MNKIIYTAVLGTMLFANSACASCATDLKPVKAEPVLADSQFNGTTWIELASMHSLGDVDKSVDFQTDIPKLANWWESFEDETMSMFILHALHNNRDIATAASKIREARASLGISRAAALPWLDSTNYWQMSRNAVEGNGARNDVTRLGIDASWEIDIFGGRQQTINASIASLKARYADLYSTWTSLASEVAVNYISLCTLNTRLQIARDNIALQTDTRDMLKSRVKSGLSDMLALNQAEYTLKQTEAMVPAVLAEIEAAKNRLAVLTGMVPGSFEDIATDGIPEIKDCEDYAKIPVNAIRQRPDIRAAEMRLVEQIAKKKAARADLYPKFYLTGAFGTELTTGSLFEGASKMYSFGPRITLPIFHWGAIKNNINVQKEKQVQMWNAYEQTVLKAAGEVRDALAGIVQEQERAAKLKAGMESAREAMLLAEDQYKNGLVDFNNVISAQKAYLSLSEDYITSRGQIAVNTVALYKAVGGGWGALE